ncbi:MAG TPA: hypothetical protein VL137_06965 [Polyangiaceae bacterium]|nr:hypothetical protein [Polyangiaceae bacterium]
MHKNNVIIRTPCGADWNAMDPRGSARLCRSCDKLVHDLSALGERDAAQLLEQTAGSLCVRYLYDQTGKIWFREDFSPLIPARRLKLGAKGVFALSALVAAPALFQACGGNAGNGRGYGGQASDGGAPAPTAENSATQPADDPAPLLSNPPAEPESLK